MFFIQLMDLFTYIQYVLTKESMYERV